MEFTQGLRALSVELNGGGGVDARVPGASAVGAGPDRTSAWQAPAGEGSGGGASRLAGKIRCAAPPAFHP